MRDPRVRLLTCNVNCNGPSKVQATLDLINNNLADLISLQEIDVHAFGAVAYTKEWRRAGCSLVLSSPEVGSQKHRVGLVSRLPIRPVLLPSTVSARAAAGLIQVSIQDALYPLLVVASYGYPGDQHATDALVDALVAFAKSFGGRFVLFGDWNATDDEGAIARHACEGSLNCLDSAFPFALPCTNPRRTRRIDFAVSDFRVSASEVSHIEGPWDHVSVCYTLDLSSCFRGFVLPKRSALRTPDACTDHARWTACWSQEAFDRALQSHDLEMAWRLLSDTAEQALQDPDSHSNHHAVPRSSAFEPRGYSEIPHARTATSGQESRGTQGLRRLRNRLVQLSHDPCDPCLRANISASLCGLRKLVPELPHMPLAQLEHFAQCVQDLYDSYVTSEKEARIFRWKCMVQESPNKQVAWLRRRADLALELQARPLPVTDVATAIHPISVLKEHGPKWEKLWTYPEDDPVRLDDINDILKDVPACPASEIMLTLEPQDLVRQAKHMSGKAPGHDSWSADDLARLPLNWWANLAQIWNSIIAGAPVPLTWSRALVALIPKKVVNTRPLGLCPIVWRIGARAIVGKLRPWIHQWITPLAFGGAPGTSCADAHLRITAAILKGAKEFIQQDLKNFFDHLSLPAVLPVLAHLGAPHALTHVLKSFYRCPTRLFKVGRFVAGGWVGVSRGFVQGCPFSPLVALAVGHAWSHRSLSRDVRGFIFVDDRLLWPRPEASCPVESTAIALARSDHFDSTFKLRCERDKCAYVTVPGQGRLGGLAQARGYQELARLDFLGIALDVEALEGRPLKLILDKVLFRVRFLKCLPISLHRKVILIRSMAFSCFTWCAGVAMPEPQILRSIQHEISALFRGAFKQEVPFFLMHEILGWESSPQFACDFAALQVANRFAVRRPSWYDDLPLDEAFVTWPDVMPVARDAVHRLGWSILPGGSGITRCDANGVRVFKFGFSNISVLKSWLTAAFRDDGVYQCRRVQRRGHRDEEACARGLDLPAPATGHSFDFAAHRAAFFGLGTLAQKRAAAASGGSFWYHNPVKCRTVTPEDPAASCACGSKFPSRPHLTWTCPVTASLRQGLPPPTDRASERLFAPPLKPFPPAPSGPNADVFRDEVAADLYSALTTTDEILVATDGSSFEDVGGYAIVIRAGTGIHSHASGNDDEDQSAFRSEACALQVLASALAAIVGKVAGNVTVLVDCQSALRAIESPLRSALPLLFEEIAKNFLAAKESGLTTRFMWVPAHDRHDKWSPNWGYDAALCRNLNKIADEQAGAAQKRRWTRSLRAAWHKELATARAWSAKAICNSAKASETYRDFLLESKCSANANPPAASRKDAEDLRPGVADVVGVG